MANWDGAASGEPRNWGSSPRAKGRENAKNTFCRNITIYGWCRNEKDGCPYNHSPVPKASNHSSQHSSSSLKQRFNVDSPSFTPGFPGDVSNNTKPRSGFSPRAASALPFTPKTAKANLVAAPAQQRTSNSEWSNQDIPEFVPQSFHGGQVSDSTQNLHVSDSFNPYDGTNSYGDMEGASSAAHYNPYAHDPGNAVTTGAGGPTIYNQQNAFAQPLNYHLYAPSGASTVPLLPYQRTVHDFFISEELRQSLQRNCEATLQALPNSSLPPSIEHFHSLVPLDTGTQKSTSSFGYNSWLYKAQSSKDARHYALRRIEGFRLTSEKAIRSVQSWKRIVNASCVTIHDCFTTRAFGDSSLIFITDYHPNSKTLHELHFANTVSHRGARPLSTSALSEPIMWGYLVQLTSALRSIHGGNLAARLLTPSKIIATGKNRLRLNANSILDVVQPAPENAPMQSIQQEDLAQLGRLLLCLASSTPNPLTFLQSPASTQRAVEALPRTYSKQMVSVITGLLDAGNPSSTSAISDVKSLSIQTADHAYSALDSSLHQDDDLIATLSRELENGRLVRLLIKLGFINERPEYNPHEPSSASVNSGAATMTPTQAALQRGAWSETGDRFYLKLFRDYVFHQVSGADGRPVVDLAHVISCLNKLDAGTEERIALVSRDEQSVIIVSYREVKRGLERAFTELRQAASAPATQSGSWR